MFPFGFLLENGSLVAFISHLKFSVPICADFENEIIQWNRIVLLFSQPILLPANSKIVIFCSEFSHETFKIIHFISNFLRRYFSFMTFIFFSSFIACTQHLIPRTVCDCDWELGISYQQKERITEVTHRKQPNAINKQNVTHSLRLFHLIITQWVRL